MDPKEPPETPAQPPAQLPPGDDAITVRQGEIDAWFAADGRRREALALLFQGNTQGAVASHLSVHRNTVNNWARTPEFVEELNRLQREHGAALRQRRRMGTSALADGTYSLAQGAMLRLQTAIATADKALSDAVAKGDPKKIRDATVYQDAASRQLRQFRELASEFRAFRGEERQDHGDNVQRVSVTSQHNHNITGEVQHTHRASDDTALSKFIQRSLDEKIIDAELLPDPEQEPGAFLLAATRQALAGTDILDQMDAEDAAAEVE